MRRTAIILGLLVLAACGADGAPEPRAAIAPPPGSIHLEEDW